MNIVERQVQQVRPGKWAVLAEIDPKFNAVESRAGLPPKRRYRCYIGGHNTDTLIVERDWEGLAAMEAAYQKLFVDPEWQALSDEVMSIIESVQYEVYAPVP